MKVYLLGAGPGDPGLLTLKARDVLAAADVVVYDALANDSLLGHARPEAELIYVGKVSGATTPPQPRGQLPAGAQGQRGQRGGRLQGRRPLHFRARRRGGRGNCWRRACPFEEVPGISSTIAAPAYAGIPLTHRDFASSVTIITGHETRTSPALCITGRLWPKAPRPWSLSWA